MKYTPNKINRWMLFKLPAAWLTGVRLTLIDESKCEVKVRFKWINQNPYRSMFWAVQAGCRANDRYAFNKIYSRLKL